jgi:outer membrane lipoprotein-sorting protein
MDGFALMNRTLNHQIRLVTLVILIVFCSGWTDSWTDIEQAASKVESIQADFVQERHLQILDRPLISTGRFYYRQPDALRWEYTAPIRSILLMHGNRIQRYVQKGETYIAESGPGVDAMQFVTAEMTNWFKGRFDQTPYFEAEFVTGSDRRVRLRPKKNGMSKMIRHIDMTFSDTPGVIESVTVFEGETSFIKLIFTHVDLNRPLPDRLFEAVE